MITPLAKPIAVPFLTSQGKIKPAIADVIELVTMWGVVATTLILLGLAWL